MTAYGDPAGPAGAVSGAEIAAAGALGERVAASVRSAVEVRPEVVGRRRRRAARRGPHPHRGPSRASGRRRSRAPSRARSAWSSRACSAPRTCCRPTSSGRTSTAGATRSSSSGPGPIFANVVVVDEINRASPKTQSGLLECMQERRVTVDVHTHELARPFVVLATQNPVEFEGTYPLPEAQVDRFMMRLSLGYPDAGAEAAMLGANEHGDRVEHLEPVGAAADVLAAQDAARRVHSADAGPRLHRRAAAPHPDRSARRARRQPARRAAAAARRQGARAAPRPRPRAARRRPGARGGGAGPPHRARARGRRRHAGDDHRGRARGDAGALRVPWRGTRAQRSGRRSSASR